MNALTQISVATSGQIHPHELPRALDGFAQLRVLSLDCFDTLIWRDCHAPTDVFAALSGMTPAQRVRAESRARQVARLTRDSSEVSIAEIYAELMPGASDAERAAAIAAELEAEATHCFAFAPTVALMLAAKDRGLQVVVVSDTYLDEGQLHGLIANSAGDEVAGLIDRVVCSSTHGKSKAGGLYGEVLGLLGVDPAHVLHIGDNPIADIAGVQPFGINTLHMMQFSAASQQRLRLEAAVGSMIHAATPEHINIPQPHRAALALAEPQLARDAERLGMAALGPVFTGFEFWLQREAERLAELHGGEVHWLFLMRDGHLPAQVHTASGHDAPAHAVEISRFTATAASFSDAEAVRDWTARELGTRPQTIARQLLMEDAAIERLLGGKDMQAASRKLWAEVRSTTTARKIVRTSHSFAERLVEHVRSVVQPKEGDVLMLIDLGYNGTVQNRIDGLLTQQFGVHVAGRYLLLREMDRPGLDKAGFIDSRHYDPHALEALCANVAVLEQAATRPCGSTVDYATDGTPMRRENDIKGAQSAVRDQLQAGCLAFQQALTGCQLRTDDAYFIQHWRQAAAATLARLMFLPMAEELTVFEAFEHDVNLGTQRTVPLFDRTLAAEGLRRRGLFYMKGSERMYLPAELQGQGMAPRLALLASQRFGLPLTFTDFSDTALELSAIFADAETATQRMVSAHATHDGYFMAALPVGQSRYSLALQFGQACEWLQLESACFVPADQLLADVADELRDEIPAEPVPDAMAEIAPGLWQCTDEAGFLLVHPPAGRDGLDYVLAVTFRPLSGGMANAA